MTQDAEYLDFAKDMADEAISKLYHQGLFRGHPAKPYYEATAGAGFLLYALLQLN
jgi:rhamnogalacturonyl hydrolase YesR